MTAYKEIKEVRDKYNKEITWMQKIPMGNKQNAKEQKKQFELNAIIKDKKNKYNFYNNLLKAFNNKH